MQLPAGHWVKVLGHSVQPYKRVVEDESDSGRDSCAPHHMRLAMQSALRTERFHQGGIVEPLQMQAPNPAYLQNRLRGLLHAMPRPDNDLRIGALKMRAVVGHHAVAR